ncbi:MAG: hypothetical protein EBX41_01305 [Chitinophagia bacterium]|nr:hypothetical protein [Chitinophagia bacterium]
MEVLNTRIAQRRSVYQQYVDRYGNHHGFTFLPEPSGYFSNRWLTTLLIDNALTGFTREDLRLALEAQNIESRPLWKPMHLQPIFSHYPYYGGSLSTTLFEQGLCLPSGSNLTEHDMKRIFDVIDSLLGRL